MTVGRFSNEPDDSFRTSGRGAPRRRAPPIDPLQDLAVRRARIRRNKSPEHAPLGPADVRNIFYGLMLAMFLSALNQTIVATALPTIGRDFGDFENLSWVIIAYLLSSTVVSPLYGKLSDIHGRRAMMLVAIGLFVAGSARCGGWRPTWRC